MTKPQPNNCGSCRFGGGGREEPGHVVCRRYPPPRDKWFPLMPPDAWCGEFQAVRK